MRVLKTKSEPRSKYGKIVRALCKVSVIVAPILTILSGCGDRIATNQNRTCSQEKAKLGILEKDVQQGETIKIGNGLEAGCISLRVRLIGADSCGSESGSTIFFDVLNNNRQMLLDSSGKTYYKAKENATTKIVALQKSNSPYSTASPIFLKINGKEYMIELLKINPLQKKARIRITDMDSKLPIRIENDDVKCKALGTYQLIGTEIKKKKLSITNLIIPNPKQIIEFDIEGRRYYLYLVGLDQSKEKITIAIQSNAMVKQIKSESCSWLNIPCDGKGYRVYIGPIEKSKEVEVRLQRL